MTLVKKKRAIGVSAEKEKFVILHATVLQTKMQLSRQLQLLENELGKIPIFHNNQSLGYFLKNMYIRIPTMATIQAAQTAISGIPRSIYKIMFFQILYHI